MKHKKGITQFEDSGPLEHRWLSQRNGNKEECIVSKLSD